MAQFTITLPDELEEEVRSTVANDNYSSVSDFVRDAIKEKLSEKPKYWERVITTLVLENNKMLQALTGGKEVEEDELLSALKRGYSSNYFDIESIAARDELPREGADFVMDVLEMYATLQRACEAHRMDKIVQDEVMFEGFDGNAGDGFLGYTNFLVDNGRFAYVKPLDKTPHLNSHSPVNDVYRRMLSAYKRIKNSHDRFGMKPLSPEEVQEIIAERIHPQYRNSQS